MTDKAPAPNYLSVDIYTCGSEGDPMPTITTLLESIGAARVVMHFIERGERPRSAA